MPPTPDLDRLRTAPWLKTAGIKRVFATLATTDSVSRAVGGAVRNTLLGHAIDDVDIATAATPEAVLAAAERAGLQAIPTGLKHGTVTLVADGQHYEVTTLRRDVETDGRHATVAFTDDWAADASRRDFTINALYCDADGTLFDPLGGSADLAPTRVRFIGDAQARIREDYLRILRFVRFSARYAETEIDTEGLRACGAERAGLARISAERIRVEFLKLLTTARGANMCRIMQAHGFLVSMLGAATSPTRLERLMAIEAQLGGAPDPVLRLAALAIHPLSDADALAKRLRLSGEERERLHMIAGTLALLRHPPSGAETRRLIYTHGASKTRDALLAAWAASEAAPSASGWNTALELTATWTLAALPVNGQDALALGLPSGPAVGELLRAVEGWWIAQDFQPDRAACLAELARLAACR